MTIGRRNERLNPVAVCLYWEKECWDFIRTIAQMYGVSACSLVEVAIDWDFLLKLYNNRISKLHTPTLDTEQEET